MKEFSIIVQIVTKIPLIFWKKLGKKRGYISMSNFPSSTWITVIMTILVLTLNWLAKKLEERGPTWVMITIRAVQIGVIGYYIYHIYGMIVG